METEAELPRYCAEVKLATFQYHKDREIIKSLIVKERILLDFQIYRDHFEFPEFLSPELSQLIGQWPTETLLRIEYNEEGILSRIQKIDNKEHNALTDYWVGKREGRLA